MKKIDTVSLGSIKIGGSNPLTLIAGPCVLENKDIVFEIAEKLKAISKELNIPYIFKASYDKANRTSIKSYRGPGLKEGLKLLNDIKEKYSLPIITDVHRSQDVQAVSEVADILQIPAFLCRQTDILVAAAKTDKIINIKKGQFIAPNDIQNAVLKIVDNGNDKVVVTERGFVFGYNNLVSDFRAIPIIQNVCPVIYDATHSIQRPGGLGNKSGGDIEYIPTLVKAAAAAGIDGLFMEVHPEPSKGLSDSSSMYPLDKMSDLLKIVKNISELVKQD